LAFGGLREEADLVLEVKVKALVLLPMVLATAVRAGTTISVDLGQIGHIASKGRVQDEEYNPGNQVVRSLIASGPEAVPFLVAKLTDDNIVKGPVFDFWPVVRVGDIALVVLCDFFTVSDWSRSTVPGLAWADLLEQHDADIPSWTALERFVTKHGRTGLQRKVETLLKPHQGKLVWDQAEHCFRPAASTPPNKRVQRTHSRVTPRA
jgi:hypothetical protein